MRNILSKMKSGIVNNNRTKEKNMAIQVIDAYSDCNDISANPRNLDFRSEESFSFDQWVNTMLRASPSYNGFDIVNIKKAVENSSMFSGFIKKCKFYPAREGSVCVYIETPSLDNDLMSMLAQSWGADEAWYEPSSTPVFRIWWD